MIDLQLITSDELAARMGYTSANNAFREWLASMRITPVPGRRGVYDPALVRRRLDEAQGLVTPREDAPSSTPADDLIGQRRARRGQS